MVRDHTDLDVWKLCDELSDRVHEITARPTFTDETLRGQLNEAADSPCPNVGEGFSRYYPRDNARFVRVAKGSVTEVIEHMAKVRKRGYATAEECDEICVLARRARGAITGYLLYLESARSPTPPSDSHRRRPIDREPRPSRSRDQSRRRSGKNAADTENRNPGTQAPRNPGIPSNTGTHRNPGTPNRNPGTCR
jgi:four helix bundle protein